MKELNFNDMRKKKVHIGFRVTEHERDYLQKFCKREQISVTDFLRYAIRIVIKQLKDSE